MKEVTKEDDDARVGSESRRIQIFSVMEELSKQLSLIYHLFSANRLPVNMSFCYEYQLIYVKSRISC